MLIRNSEIKELSEKIRKAIDGQKVEDVYKRQTTEYGNCLESGKVDLMLGADVYMQEDYNVAAMIPAEPYYIVTAKDEPELCLSLIHI